MSYNYSLYLEYMCNVDLNNFTYIQLLFNVSKLTFNYPICDFITYKCSRALLFHVFMPPKELRWHIKIEPSVRPSVTNRVSAISHRLLKQI